MDLPKKPHMAVCVHRMHRTTNTLCGLGLCVARAMHRIGTNEMIRGSRSFRILQHWPALALILLPACQQQMASQPSYRPDQPSAFFADGRAARPLVPGTVARGHLRTDTHLFTGTQGDETRDLAAALAVPGARNNPLAYASIVAAETMLEEKSESRVFPFPMTADVLRHGQNRYMIYCVVCHDPLGTGHGTIVERGYTPPPSYHIERLRKAPPGHFFRVITRGYGSMPSHAHQIPPRDRWAIAGYVRALQLSQHFPEKDLPDDMRRDWNKKQIAVGGPAQ
jgi:mono/diheme cytochrome c family protein